MVEKNSHHLPLDEENVLDFEVAKDLTIEEAVKKQKEIKNLYFFISSNQ